MATLRRTERSRACAGASGRALRRARNAMADELIGLCALQPGRPVPAGRGVLHRVLHAGCPLFLPSAGACAYERRANGPDTTNVRPTGTGSPVVMAPATLRLRRLRRRDIRIRM